MGWRGDGEEGDGKLVPFQVAPLPIIHCASCELHFSGSSQRTSQQNLIKPEPFSTSIIRNTQFTQVIRPPNYKPMFLRARFPLLIAPSLGSANGPWLLSHRPWRLCHWAKSLELVLVLVFLRQWFQHGEDPKHPWEPSCRLGMPPGHDGWGAGQESPRADLC